MEPAIASSCIAFLLSYAYYRQSLTPAGLVTAGLIATVHAFHPFSVFFGLLGLFFLAGTFVTKIKHSYKATLTSTAAGGSSQPSAPHPRNATQVFANSFIASALVLTHALCLRMYMQQAPESLKTNQSSFPPTCLSYPFPSAVILPKSAPSTQVFVNLTPYAVMAAYATAAADTFASELGILTSTRPVFLPSLLVGRIWRVPPGTNGGVTVEGVLASALGAFFIAMFSLLMTPWCGGDSGIIEKRAAFVNGHPPGHVSTLGVEWTMNAKLVFVLILTTWGTAGALLDSLLGALFQASVVEARSGKVIEGEGGAKVMYMRLKGKSEDSHTGRLLLTGRDWLSNNGVNLVTGLVMSLGAIVAMTSSRLERENP